MDVEEAAGLGAEVVDGAGGADVLVVVAAGELDVALGGDGVGGVVVGDGVGAEDVVAVGEDDVAGGVADVAVAGLGVVAVDVGDARGPGRGEGARRGGWWRGRGIWVSGACVSWGAGRGCGEYVLIWELKWGVPWGLRPVHADFGTPRRVGW